METSININRTSPKFQDMLLAPMHTAEHLLNSQMVKYFHCERSFSAHIEKKKSKCDYHFTTAPSAEDIATVEQAVNDIIQQNINVEEIFYPIDQVPACINLTRLPEPGIKTVLDRSDRRFLPR
jgi:misacylated tRNA(Ala) deacylase